MKNKKFLVNKEIRARRVIVIDSQGKRLGEFMKWDAIDLAKDRGLDLVQLNNDETPICRLQDHGKFLYDQKKRAKASKSSNTKMKEVKFSPRIDIGDFNVRVKSAKRFLESGNQVKVSVFMKRHDMRNTHVAREKCNEFVEALADFGKLDSKISQVGRQFSFVLLPTNGKKQ